MDVTFRSRSGGRGALIGAAWLRYPAGCEVRRVSFAVLAMVFAVTGAAACTDASNKNPTEASARSSNPSPVAPTAQESAAPDTSVVRVVDFGFSTFTSGAGESVCSYGVLVENGSSVYTATAVTVRIRMFDGDGREVTVEPALRHLMPEGRVSIDRALPRGRAIAAGTFVRDGAVPKRMTVEFVNAYWYPPGTLSINATTIAADKPVTASDVKVDRRLAEKAPQVISFTMDSPYDQELPNGYAMALLYDGSGKIVGGTGASDSMVHKIAPGKSSGTIVPRPGYISPQADDTKTQVFLIPG